MKPILTQVKDNAGVITIGSIVGFIIAAPKVGEGIDWLRKVCGTVETAYAGYEIATETKGDFESYLHEQKKALEMESQRQELQAQFNQQLLAIQQQQDQSNQQIQSMPAYHIDTDENGKCWICFDSSEQLCWDKKLWKPCEGM